MKTQTTLKHTWNKDLPFPIEVKLHVDVEGQTYWMELNGCQETARMSIPNKGWNEQKEETTYEYECCACKGRVPTVPETTTREEAKTCPLCGKREGFIMVEVKAE